MPHFGKGEYFNVRFDASPTEWWRKSLSKFGIVIPYMVGQRIVFDLTLEKREGTSRDRDTITLYYVYPDKHPREAMNLKIPSKTTVQGFAATSTGTIEYRFGLPIEDSSILVVSVQGNENDAIMWIALTLLGEFVLGLVVGVIIWVLPLIVQK
ncbi:MAG: hypothetical protein HYZ26_13150 [Chloroflexi bacterium]|nr:hypothetical protein [Chloroflexota bacterium]